MKKIDKKTLIGVLASHDSEEKNKELAEVFVDLYNSPNKTTLENFHFVFTGGTFDRIVMGYRPQNFSQAQQIPDVATRTFVEKNSTRLPTFPAGGVTILANLFGQRQCNIVWCFLSPNTTHWLNPENLALMRLVDRWRDTRLMNKASVEDWFEKEAREAAKRNQQEIPLKLFSCSDPSNQLLAEADKGKIQKGNASLELDKYREIYCVDYPEKNPEIREHTIALIAHDAMKDRMVDFVMEFEDKLQTFGRILTTGATGKQIQDNSKLLAGKVKLCRSGPDGGDIEIASEVLFDRCKAVVFFIDPLHPHAHIDDIRTVVSACMRKPVHILTNDYQARKWAEQL